MVTAGSDGEYDRPIFRPHHAVLRAFAQPSKQPGLSRTRQHGEKEMLAEICTRQRMMNAPADEAASDHLGWRQQLECQQEKVLGKACP
ncbi:hypothetical protein D7B24_006003 [Verticillium nonalfalfae]|uniref:Uncharacterized protein n=1 Tax=Verticillium nonalfalfae TaxID=1051616 RepID=A0A3M9YLC1_9PEZI|nr:uncharacterized protein D7B24_006003 [Verticillium nonalfalfae]RNJ60851.1 hypothetical protein D7B24_006003 [Verticillium nonalfalfae]